MRSLLSGVVAMAVAGACVYGAEVSARGSRAVNVSYGIPFDAGAFPSLLAHYEPSGIFGTGTATVWTDHGPNANNEVPTGTGPTIVSSAINGYSALKGASATPTCMQSVSNFTFSAGSSLTVHIVANYAGSYGVDLQTQNGSTGPALRLFSEYGSIFNVLGGSNGGVNYPSLLNGWGIYTAVFTNTPASGQSAYNMYWGRSVMGWAPGGGTTGNLVDGLLNLFCTQGGSNPVNDTIAEILVYQSSETPANTQAITDYLSAKYNIQNAIPTKSLAVYGDSISSDDEATPWTSLFVQDSSFPPSVWQLASSSYDGNRLASYIASLPYQLAQMRAGTTKHAIIFAGTNDFANSTTLTPSTLFNGSLVPFIQALQAAGISYIDVATMLPRCGLFTGGVTQASFEAVREGTGSWNPLIRGGASTYGYTTIDVASDATIGQAGQCTNTTNYNVDGVHPNTAVGQPILYTHFKAAIAAWP